MEKLYWFKDKLIKFYRIIDNKIGFKKFVALIIVVAVIAQIITGIAINIAVMGKDGIAGSEKAKKLIHVELSEPKYISWMEKKTEQIEISGENGHILKAEKLKNYNSSHSYIIVSHPYAKNAFDMAEFAYHFYDLGFHVYLPYMRGFGESDYDTVSMGYEDYKDILRWVNEIIEKDKEAKIFLFGMGIGGTASLLTADKDLPENVKGIIADSAYSDLKELFKFNIKEFYSVPAFPTVEIGSLYNKLTSGWAYTDIDVATSVKNSEVPVFYVQGGEDQIVPTEQINDLYDMTTYENSDHLLVPGATHCENADFEPEDYWADIDLFVLNTMDL